MVGVFVFAFHVPKYPLVFSVTHEAFPLASDCNTRPAAAPDVIMKLVVAIVPATSNSTAGTVLPTPIPTFPLKWF